MKTINKLTQTKKLLSIVLLALTLGISACGEKGEPTIANPSPTAIVSDQPPLKRDENSGVVLAIPNVETRSIPATDVHFVSAKLAGNVIGNGGSVITEYGILYNISPNVTADVNGCQKLMTKGSITGSFDFTPTNLRYNTTYYYKAYTKNAVGFCYSSKEYSFTTPALATTTTTWRATGIESALSVDNSINRNPTPYFTTGRTNPTLGISATPPYTINNAVARNMYNEYANFTKGPNLPAYKDTYLNLQNTTLIINPQDRKSVLNLFYRDNPKVVSSTNPPLLGGQFEFLLDAADLSTSDIAAFNYKDNLVALTVPPIGAEQSNIRDIMDLYIVLKSDNTLELYLYTKVGYPVGTLTRYRHYINKITFTKQ